MNLLAYIYQTFQYFIKRNCPEIKSIDLFFDQFTTQMEGESDPLMNPRILIEILEFEPQSGFGGYQQWEGEVKLHIGIDIIQTFNSLMDKQDKNLSYLTTLDNIYKGLSDIKASYLPTELLNNNFTISNIQRNRIEFATNPDAIKVSTITFKMIVEDYSRTEETASTTLETVVLTDYYDIPN